MNKKYILPGALVLAGLILRFFFTGVGYIAYALFFAAALVAIMRFCPKAWIKRTVCILTALGLAYLIVVEVPIVGAASGDGDKEYDYIIVLGAAVHGDTPSLSLVERMSAARDYMQAHPQTIAIVSGGQGSDEPMSEAQAIKNSLVEKGISPDRIIMEDKSENTFQNIRNSLEIFDSMGMSRKAVIITSEFHQLRAKMIASKQGLECYSKSSPTYPPLLPSYWVREWFGVLHELIIGRK